jgi:hypothetical protein
MMKRTRMPMAMVIEPSMMYSHYESSVLCPEYATLVSSGEALERRTFRASG